MPPLELPRVLVVGAHPDDWEFGCGGVVAGEHARGAAIAVILCSRGESATNGTPAEREREARAAAALVGADVEFLDFGGDARMEERSAHAVSLARCIRSFQPGIFLAPTSTPDQHPDHAVVGHLAQSAARLARYGGVPELRDLPPHAVDRVLAYAVTPGGEPDGLSRRLGLRVDISPHVDAWRTLMECHATQLRTRRYLDLQFARARALGLESGVEHAQALFPADPLLVRSLGELPPAARLF